MTRSQSSAGPPSGGTSGAPSGQASPQSGQSSQQSAQQSTQSRGPVGTGDRVIREGDCVSSIAKETGHFWQTIWDDPANSELKSARQDPNVLLPGDRMTVPELRRKEESGATEMRHRFRRKGEPARLKLRLVEEPDEQREAREQIQPVSNRGRVTATEEPEGSEEAVEDRPRANVPYVFEVDGQRTEGTTDENGCLEVPIPGNARRGKLTLNPGTDRAEEIRLNLGHLDPISEVIGVKQRLANLTFECGDRTSEMTDGLHQAIRAFQQKHGMEENGELSDEVRQRIQEVHGS